MILHRYFARRFLLSFLAVLAVFGLFQFLLDLIEELRQAADGMRFAQVAQLSALKLPAGLYQIMPLVMILSTIALFLALARSSELVVARAAGRSGLVVVSAPVLVSALIGAVTVATMNPIVAATSQRYTDLREVLRSGEASTLSIGSEGLWLRQGGAEGQAVIRAARADADVRPTVRLAPPVEWRPAPRGVLSKCKWRFTRFPPIRHEQTDRKSVV